MRKEWIIAGLLALTLAGCGSSSSSSSEGSTASSAPATSTSTQTTSTQASGGSGAGHTSEWTAADTAGAEGDLAKESSGEGLSAAFKSCLIKGVEATFSPAEYKEDNKDNKEAGKARGIAEKCAKEFPPTGK